MTQTLEQLNVQHQALRSIRGIVRTMKALAAVNAQPYERAARAIAAYQNTIRQGFAAYAWAMQGRIAAAGSPPPRRHRIVVAFGSDHGFCGNYNGLVAATACKARQTRPASVVICVGARMQAALKEQGAIADHVLLPPASTEGLARVAGEVLSLLEGARRGHEIQELDVDLAFMRRSAHAGQTPALSPLLPLDPALLQAPRRWPSRALPHFHAPLPVVFSALVRNHLFARIFQVCAEALVTENAARLARMQQAEQSVDDRLATLGQRLAGVRQDAITDELMDIIIGHEAHRRRQDRQAAESSGHSSARSRC